jgi:hypothetical protein
MTWSKNMPQIFKSRYTRSLEEDIARLRNENRALINSILGISGLPPLRLDAEIARDNHRAEIEIKSRRSSAPTVSRGTAVIGRDHPGKSIGPAPLQFDANPEQHPSSPAPGQGIMLSANPHRRRSWQQINRILEMEEARQIENRDNSDAMQPRTPELKGGVGHRE